jgi:hypothetical protein
MATALGLKILRASKRFAAIRFDLREVTKQSQIDGQRWHFS